MFHMMKGIFKLHHAMDVMTDLLKTCEMKILHFNASYFSSCLGTQNTPRWCLLCGKNIFHYSTFMEMRIGIQLP